MCFAHVQLFHMEKALRIGQSWVYDNVKHCLLSLLLLFRGGVGQGRKVGIEVQRRRPLWRGGGSLSVGLGQSHRPHGSTLIHIPLSHPLQHHLPRAYPDCHLGSHGLLLYISVSFPLSKTSALFPFGFSTCVIGPCHLQAISFPSVHLSLILSLSVFTCL